MADENQNEAEDGRDGGFTAEELEVRDQVKEELKEFLSANPDSWAQGVTVKGKVEAVVYDPWGDESIAIRLRGDRAAAVAMLNRLHLPKRYSAIYHREAKKLEVIWTAWKLDELQAEVIGREFELEIDGRVLKCWFGRSSDDLLTLARIVVPLGISASDFRNIRSYSAYLTASDKEGELPSAFGEPVSFWIENVEWSDDNVLNIVRHVNFYLKYYDSESPVVLVHPQPADSTVAPRNRYFAGLGFPPKIVSRALDANLLVLWNASFGPSRASNFLNFYRIIEYVSYYYMHEDARNEVREIIKKPHVLGDVDRAARDILLVLRSVKHQREQDAIIMLLKEVIKPNVVWQEVAKNQEFFTRRTAFDGQLVLDPLITEKDKEENFGKAGVERVASSLVKIRNALAHGRDTNSHKTILPTSRNFDLLQPWLHLITVAAGEVVLFDTVR